MSANTSADEQLVSGSAVRRVIDALRGNRLAGVALAFVLGLVGLGGWALSSPVGSEPDSDFHLASIWCTTADPGSPCDMEERRNQKMVPAALIDARCYSHDRDASAACQPLMTTADGRETMTNRLNIVESQSGYPAGFYIFNNTLAGENIDTSVFTMRMINVVLFLGIGAALWLLLPVRLRNAMTWAWAVTIVPLGVFVIASTNPSSWALIGVGYSWVALLGYLEAEGYRRWVLGVFFLLTVGMAAASRTDATLFAIATAGVALLASDAPAKQLVKRLWIPAVGAVLAIAVLFFQRGAIGVLLKGFMRDREVVDWERLWFNFIEIPALWMGVFGGWPFGALGWLDTPMPQLVGFLSFGAFVAVFGIAVTSSTWRVRAMTALMIAMLWVYPLFILQQADELVGLVFQSRYALPLVPVLIGIALLRPAGHGGILPNPTHRLWIVGALSIANAVALHQNIRRYVTGYDSFGYNLNNSEWWWFGLRESWLTPMAVWYLGSLAFFGFLWVVLMWGADHVINNSPARKNTSPRLIRPRDIR